LKYTTCIYTYVHRYISVYVHVCLCMYVYTHVFICTYEDGIMKPAKQSSKREGKREDSVEV
jgi:hypothetical protein